MLSWVSMSKNGNKSFVKMKGKFWERRLPKLGCYGNVNVDVHISRRLLNCPIYSHIDTSLKCLEVIQFFSFGVEGSKKKKFKITEKTNIN